mgnify:CR=1 FL=1
MEVKILDTIPNEVEGINIIKLSNILKNISEENKALIIENRSYIIIQIPEDHYKDAENLNGWGLKYAEYVYGREDLEDYEQEGLVDLIPKVRISLAEYQANNVAQELYDKVINIDYTGKPLFVLKFDKETKELYIKELEK